MRSLGNSAGSIYQTSAERCNNCSFSEAYQLLAYQVNCLIVKMTELTLPSTARFWVQAQGMLASDLSTKNNFRIILAWIKYPCPLASLAERAGEPFHSCNQLKTGGLRWRVLDNLCNQCTARLEYPWKKITTGWHAKDACGLLR